MFEVTPAQKDAYNRNGYVVIPNLIDADEALAMGEHYDAIVKARLEQMAAEGKTRKGQLVQLPGPVSSGEPWRDRPYFGRVLDVGRQLNGDDIEFSYDQIIMKPPQYDATTPWHQDAGYWRTIPAAAARAVTSWLALSNVTIEHGCMEFIPGSHKGEIVDHISIAEQSEINGALEAVGDKSAAVKVPLRPGDATFHHARTLHFTAGNLADTARRGLVTHLWPHDAHAERRARNEELERQKADAERAKA